MKPKQLKKLWKTIKSIYAENKIEKSCVKFDDKILTDKSKIAKQLKKLFVKSIVQINKKNSIKPYNIYLDKFDEVKFKFDLKTVSQNEIISYASEIKNKSSSELISGKILCDALKDIK